MKLVKHTIIISMLLNIALPLLFKPFATSVEVKPPNGAANLSLKGQFMHMMVHHNQVQLTSSIIVALIFFSSISLASYSK
jgi:hypothetical protein